MYWELRSKTFCLLVSRLGRDASPSIKTKSNFCINTDSIFIEIFLPKSKPVLIGILYRPPNKYDFVNCLERTFSETNAFESQECYLLGDININLQPKDKEIFRHKPANTINKEITHLTRSYLEFCFTHSLEQIITRPARVTDWPYTCKLTRQSQSIRRHRSWSFWPWPDLLHKKDIPAKIP